MNMSSSSSSSSSSSAAYVLYIDHAGHPAPLTSCYHATASRRLSSSIDKSPPSTITETDSAYCPQCLSFHDIATALGTHGGRCRNPHCRQCPICMAVLSVSIDRSLCLEGETGLLCTYRCGHCRWTSEECGIMSQVNSVDKEGIENATKDLAKEVDKRLDTAQEKSSEEHFRSVVDGLLKKALEEEKKKREEDVIKRSRSTKRGDGPEDWSIERLERSIQIRKEKLAYSTNESSLGKPFTKMCLKDLDEAHFMNQSVGDVSAEQAVTQSVVSVVTPKTSADLLPIQIPFRARKSRRCRAELEAGRPGILLKPKMNPLEGDSSLRSGHGQWWKKDSSAVHVVPKVQVVRHGSDTTSSFVRQALLLMVKNPTLGTVRLRFNKHQKSGSFTNKEQILKDIMVDSMKRKNVDALLICCSTAGLNPSELVELDPVEDAFLELGKGQKGDPDNVESWNASSALSESKVGLDSTHPLSSIRLVATRNDTAWMELIVALQDASLRSYSDAASMDFVAVPVSLEVEVGNGSWESSLIKPLQQDGDEPDFVSLDLVILWEGGVCQNIDT